MPKRFVFKLEKVLKVRSIYKRLAEREVYSTKHALSRNADSLNQAQQDAVYGYQELQTDPSMMVSWSHQMHAYHQYLKVRKTQLESQREALNQQLKRDLAELNQKVRDEKVMEKLKERLHQRHVAETDAFFQKEIEELDLIKRGKNR